MRLHRHRHCLQVGQNPSDCPFGPRFEIEHEIERRGARLALRGALPCLRSRSSRGTPPRPARPARKVRLL
jgi:hypothetical protein